MPKFLLLDSNNFIDFPIGGTLSFDRQLLKCIPSSDIALVGITTEISRVGKWTTLKINDCDYDFFAITHLKNTSKKPLIPIRLQTFIALIRYMKRIRSKHIRNIFTQTPQFAILLSWFKWNSICFCFAGVGNSIALSRYKSLRFLGNIYERVLFKAISKSKFTILAAADSNSIQILKDRSRNLLKLKNIKTFPTRYDEKIFFPKDTLESRKTLNLSEDKIILVTTGRLCWVKGWELLIETFENFSKQIESLLIFVGDGEDRSSIEEKIKQLNLTNQVIITGFIKPEDVALYINASNVFLIGSYTEGWSTSMIEALACGKPVVTTNISSSSDLITNGKNGFILEDRDSHNMSELIKNILKNKESSQFSLNIAKTYSLSNLYNDLLNNWIDIK